MSYSYAYNPILKLAKRDFVYFFHLLPTIMLIPLISCKCKFFMFKVLTVLFFLFSLIHKHKHYFLSK